MFRLGYYHIYYRDGSEEKVEILWGENIGPCEIANIFATDDFYEGESSADFHCEETVFTCEFEDKEDKRYYRFVIPTDKAVDRVVPELFEEYRDRVLISRVDIVNP